MKSRIGHPGKGNLVVNKYPIEKNTTKAHLRIKIFMHKQNYQPMIQIWSHKNLARYTKTLSYHQKLNVI